MTGEARTPQERRRALEQQAAARKHVEQRGVIGFSYRPTPPSGPSPESTPQEELDLRPPRLAVDAKGYVWRVYDEYWSMCPVNPDNSSIPKPVTFYEPTVVQEGSALVEVEAIREALENAEHRYAKEAETNDFENDELEDTE